jgi:uncharacterized protein Usg
MTDLELQILRGYRLTTAEIIYHMPDFPKILQSYVWQNYDHAPDFPELKKFLEFWEKSLEGKMHSVIITSTEIIHPSECHYADMSFNIH